MAYTAAGGGPYSLPVVDLLGTGQPAGAGLSSGFQLCKVYSEPLTIFFHEQPQSQNAQGGQTVNLSVIASCTRPYPLSYQWQNSQGFISGATNATYTIFNFQPTNAGNYSEIVTNSFTSMTSAVATVTIVSPPTISTNPISQILPAGSSLILTAAATGAPPPVYQWQNGASPLPGETNSSLIFNPAQTNHTDSYSVIVSNAYGMATSLVASVMVYQPVSILTQPVSLVVPYQTPAAFGVTASGFPAPTSFQWTHAGTNVPGATANFFHLSQVRLADAGNYQVQVSNGYSSTNSGLATLSLSPSIVSAFGGAALIWGREATLFVGATGSGALNYQWYKDGVPMDGANLPALYFASIQFTNAGVYSVVVTSPFGSVTNEAAQVVVNPAEVSLGFYPGLTFNNVSGNSYVIQSSADLTNTNGWNTLTNLTVTQPVQLWVDTNANASSPFKSKTFYRILPGQ